MDDPGAGHCEDCHSVGQLIKTPAGPDDHTSCVNSITKYVCKDGCNFNCSSCGHINLAKNEDGWFFDIVCSECGHTFTPKFTWYGLDLPTACNRYCFDGTSSVCKKLRDIIDKMDVVHVWFSDLMNIGENFISINVCENVPLTLYFNTSDEKMEFIHALYKNEEIKLYYNIDNNRVYKFEKHYNYF